MRMRHREEAICLRTTDYSETSQIVHFLTRGCGVVRLIAKGAKRPRSTSGGALDLLSEGDLVFTESRSGSLGVLIEFSESTSRSTLRKDAARLGAALYAIELVAEMLAEADPLPKAFDLLHNALLRMGQADAPVQAVLAYFQWRLLRHVGLLGELRRCASCGGEVNRERDTYFSSASGGLLCDRCQAGATEKVPVERSVLAGMVALAAAESGRRASLPDALAKGVNRLLAYHASYQIGKPLKMSRHAIQPMRRKNRRNNGGS